MALSRFTLLALTVLASLWWLLSNGDPASWIIGLPAVAAAAWSARRLGLADAGAVSLAGLLRFTPFFAWESLRGGMDVAMRTLSPRMRIQPGFVVYETLLSDPGARAFFAGCVNLLPGTLAADIDGNRLDVHLLDSQSDYENELRRLEIAVARVYPQHTTDSQISRAL